MGVRQRNRKDVAIQESRNALSPSCLPAWELATSQLQRQERFCEPSLQRVLMGTPSLPETTHLLSSPHCPPGRSPKTVQNWYPEKDASRQAGRQRHRHSLLLGAGSSPSVQSLSSPLRHDTAQVALSSTGKWCSHLILTMTSAESSGRMVLADGLTTEEGFHVVP